MVEVQRFEALLATYTPARGQVSIKLGFLHSDTTQASAQKEQVCYYGARFRKDLLFEMRYAKDQRDNDIFHLEMGKASTL